MHISTGKNYFFHGWKHIFQLVETLMAEVMVLLMFLLQETSIVKTIIFPLAETYFITFAHWLPNSGNVFPSNWSTYLCLHELSFPVVEIYLHQWKRIFLLVKTIVPSTGNVTLISAKTHFILWNIIPTSENILILQ